MKSRRKKQSESRWCAPEHFKHNCSWKGDKLIASNFGGKKRVCKESVFCMPCDCGDNFDNAFVVKTEFHTAKRYVKNNTIIEIRK